MTTHILATDIAHSPLAISPPTPPRRWVYTPFGLLRDDSLAPYPGYNGQWREGVHYLLGNGYRLYSPTLKRFCAPDSWSPFGAGGSNAYAYCRAEPVNATDGTGHAWKKLLELLRLKKKASGASALISNSPHSPVGLRNPAFEAELPRSPASPPQPSRADALPPPIPPRANRHLKPSLRGTKAYGKQGITLERNDRAGIPEDEQFHNVHSQHKYAGVGYSGGRVWVRDTGEHYQEVRIRRYF